jgi:hypothetical protein
VKVRENYIHLYYSAPIRRLCLTKRPSGSGKTKKPGPSTKGASGKPPKVEPEGPAPSPPGFVALEARGEAKGFGATAKAEAEGFAPPPRPFGANAQAPTVDQWQPQTSNFVYQPSPPPFSAAMQSAEEPGEPPADTEIHNLEAKGIETGGATVGQPSLQQTHAFELNSISTGAAPTGGTAPTPVASDPKAGIVAIVEGRLSREPAAIRDLARNLSQEFASQAEHLKRSRPNDERLAQHDDLIAFFERMAAGLAELANALDQAIKEGTGGSLESGSLGKAAQIARGLHQGVMQWIDLNFTRTFDCALRFGLFAAGIAFLHSIGADYAVTVGALGTLALKGGQAKDRPKAKDDRAKDRPKSEKKPKKNGPPD